MSAKKKVKKPINRKGPEKPRGLNVRGLKPDMLAWFAVQAKDMMISTEAYVRWYLANALMHDEAFTAWALANIRDMTGAPSNAARTLPPPDELPG